MGGTRVIPTARKPIQTEEWSPVDRRSRNRWVITGLGVALGVVGLIYIYHISSYYSQFRADLAHDAEIVASQSAADVAAGDRISAGNTLAMLEGNKSILAAAILTQEGRIFAQWTRNGAHPPPRYIGRYGTYLEGGRLTHSIPLSVDGQPVGTLYLQAGLQKVYRQLLMELPIAIGIIAAILVLAFVFPSTLQRRISEPISRKLREMRTQLKDARQAAHVADQMKSQFLANITHEIRSPMNAVIGMTDLLLKTPLNKKQQEYVETIRHSGDSLLAVIDDILDLSKLQAGELQLESVAFDIDDVVEPVLDMFGYRASAKALELYYRRNKAVPGGVQGDPHRLRQVLVNLVGNAVKFTEKGEIVIDASLEHQDTGEVSLWFSVQDTGPGIPPELKYRLFRPFTQFDASTTRRYGGTGLGLAISKRLVEMMGGKLHVDSEVGVGSVFSFTIPVKMSGVRTTAEPSAALAGRRVLVIDDNPAVHDVILDYLAAEGMRGNYAPPGAEALKRLRHESDRDPYDLALIDTNMPSGSGLAMTRQIKADPRIAAMPIILLTSMAHTLPPGFVSSLQGVRCLNKPVLPTGLRTCVLDLLTQDSTVPLPVSAPRASSLSAGDATPVIADGIRVLVAEDNAISRQLLLNMLQQLGFKSDAVCDGLAVLQAAEGTAYDLILLDCQMPGMDGYGVAAELRRRAQAGVRPVIIAVTAHASPQDRKRCQQAGMDDYLAKPVRLESLERLLRTWLQGHNPETASSTSAESPPFDAEALERLGQTGNGGRPGVLSLTQLFVSDAAQRLSALSKALQEGRLNDLARRAHALKGGCLQVGSKPMVKLCDELEDAAKSGQVEAVDSIIRSLHRELSRVRRTTSQTASNSDEHAPLILRGGK